MPDTVSSDTIESLASKLADFADALSDDERHALDLFFLQPSDVEGFTMGSVGGGLSARGFFGDDGGVGEIAKGKGKGKRQEYYQLTLENTLITSY